MNDTAAAAIQDLAHAVLETRSPMDSMKLQKLCYLIYSEYLAVTGEALVATGPEAWPSGPVFRELFDVHSNGPDSFSLTPDMIPGEPLSEYPMAIVKHIVDYYGPMSGMGLQRMTQKHLPWMEARERSIDKVAAALDPVIVGSFYRAWVDAPETAVQYANRFAGNYLTPLNAKDSDADQH